MKRLGVFIPPSPPSTPMLSCKSPAAISTDILLPAPSLLQLYHNCWQSCQHHPDLQIGEFYAWVFLNYAPFPFFYTVQSTHPCFQWEHHHPFFFQASSFQLLKLENFLRWSFFTFIYNLSSNMNYFIYTSNQSPAVLTNPPCSPTSSNKTSTCLSRSLLPVDQTTNMKKMWTSNACRELGWKKNFKT